RPFRNLFPTRGPKSHKRLHPGRKKEREREREREREGERKRERGEGVGTKGGEENFFHPVAVEVGGNERRRRLVDLLTAADVSRRRVQNNLVPAELEREGAEEREGKAGEKREEEREGNRE